MNYVLIFWQVVATKEVFGENWVAWNIVLVNLSAGISYKALITLKHIIACVLVIWIIYVSL